jgi:hypothetical protein
MVVFRNRARRLTELPELLLTSPHWPGVRKQFPSILVLAHLLDGNPVLSFGWGIYNIAHKKRAIVTNTIEKMMAKIASPKMVRLIATPSRSSYRSVAALSAGGAMGRTASVS